MSNAFTLDDSILETVLSMLGDTLYGDDFDSALIPLINTYLMVLYQIGVGKDGFEITGHNETWGDFCDDIKKFQGIKTYVYIRTKLAFDPPQSSSVIEAYEKLYKELESRLSTKVDTGY